MKRNTPAASFLSCVLLLLFPVTALALNHPGILNSKKDLAFAKAQVAAGAQPWKDAFDKMKALPEASLDYQPKPHAEVNCGSGSRPDFGCSDEKRDSQAAYLHALLWVMTDVDPTHFDTRAKIDKHWHGQTVLFDGLSQETGRDLTHTQWGIGGLIHCAEIAWNQGIDLYGQGNNRILRGMEFHAKYLDGAPVPADPQNGKLRGIDRVCPMWEIGFNHYHGRLKLPMPETEKLLQKHRPEIGPDHHLGFGTLTHFGSGEAQAADQSPQGTR